MHEGIIIYTNSLPIGLDWSHYTDREIKKKRNKKKKTKN